MKRRLPFVKPFLFAYCIVINSGLAFGQSNGDQSVRETDEEILNPLAELIGFGPRMIPDFGEDISKAMAEQRQAMDMHKQMMDNHKDMFGSLMEEQQKEIQEFHQHFKDLEKEFNDEFNKPMDEAFNQMAAPFMAFGTPEEREPIIEAVGHTMPKKNASRTELPLFHPKAEPDSDFLDTLFGNFQPVLKELQDDVQKRKNEADKAKGEHKAQEEDHTPFNFFGWEASDNISEANVVNETQPVDGSLVSDFLTTLVGSFGKIFANNAEKNEKIGEDVKKEAIKEVTSTTSSEPNTTPTTESSTHRSESSPPETQTSPEVLAPEEDNNNYKEIFLKAEPRLNDLKDLEMARDLQQLGEAIEFYRDSGFWPVDVAVRTPESLNKLIEIENKLEDRFRREWNVKEEQIAGPTTPSGLAIHQKLSHEIKIVTKKDKDYEWYDWTLVGVIAGTSSLLMLIALYICAQKSMRSKKEKITAKSAEEGIVEQVVRMKAKPVVPENTVNDGVANENLSNKYAEKIKTIFVNLK